MPARRRRSVERHPFARWRIRCREKPMLDLFLAAFVTFFVVIDPPGVAPMFASLTQDMPPAWRRAMAFKSVFIATLVLLGFALGGQWLLDKLAVSLDAFRIAGGLLLFLIAVDMLFEKQTERREEPSAPGSRSDDDGARRELSCRRLDGDVIDLLAQAGDGRLVDDLAAGRSRSVEQRGNRTIRAERAAVGLEQRRLVGVERDRPARGCSPPIENLVRRAALSKRRGHVESGRADVERSSVRD